MSKILRTPRLTFQDVMISILEMLLISLIPIEVEEYLYMNFIVVFKLLESMQPLKKQSCSSLDMIQATTEDLKPESLRLDSLPMMPLLAPKLPEDHQIIPQDQLEEMTASSQELLLNSKACGELTLELKTQPS